MLLHWKRARDKWVLYILYCCSTFVVLISCFSQLNTISSWSLMLVGLLLSTLVFLCITATQNLQILGIRRDSFTQQSNILVSLYFLLIWSGVGALTLITSGKGSIIISLLFDELLRYPSVLLMFVSFVVLLFLSIIVKFTLSFFASSVEVELHTISIHNDVIIFRINDLGEEYTSSYKCTIMVKALNKTLCYEGVVNRSTLVCKTNDLLLKQVKNINELPSIFIKSLKPILPNHVKNSTIVCNSFYALAALELDSTNTVIYVTPNLVSAPYLSSFIEKKVPFKHLVINEWQHYKKQLPSQETLFVLLD